MTARSYWMITLWWHRACHFHLTRSHLKSVSPHGKANWSWLRMWWMNGCSVRDSGCIWSLSLAPRISIASCQWRARDIRPWRGYGGKSWTARKKILRSLYKQIQFPSFLTISRGCTVPCQSRRVFHKGPKKKKSPIPDSKTSLYRKTYMHLSMDPCNNLCP